MTTVMTIEAIILITLAATTVIYLMLNWFEVKEKPHGKRKTKV